MQISDIIIGERHRKQMGDIEGLARNIEKNGLLHPVVVAPDRRLITGKRRIEAYKLLKREDILVTIVDLPSIVEGEYAENTQRLDFAPSEIVDISRAVRPVEETAARKRQLANLKQGNETLVPEIFRNGDKGDTRDKVARYTGISGKTLEKAEAVVEAAEKEPEKYTGLVEEMDRTGKVDPCYRKMRKQQMQESLGDPPPLPEGKYRTLVIDPPWSMDRSERTARPEQEPVLDYPVMDLEAIINLPIAELAAENCHVYLLTTHRFLPDAFGVFKSEKWEVKYHCLLTWVKNVGFTPFSWMFSTEHCLFGWRGSFEFPNKGERVEFSAPVREHSRKPEEFYEKVWRVSPEPRLELFSREPHEGFIPWGNEVNKFSGQEL